MFTQSTVAEVQGTSVTPTCYAHAQGRIHSWLKKIPLLLMGLCLGLIAKAQTFSTYSILASPCQTEWAAKTDVIFPYPWVVTLSISWPEEEDSDFFAANLRIPDILPGLMGNDILLHCYQDSIRLPESSLPSLKLGFSDSLYIDLTNPGGATFNKVELSFSINIVDTSTLLAQMEYGLGGGIVLVENATFKQGPMQTIREVDPEAKPRWNQDRNLLWDTHNLPNSCKTQLINGQGQIVAECDSGVGKLEAYALPRGRYYLHFRGASINKVYSLIKY